MQTHRFHPIRRVGLFFTVLGHFAEHTCQPAGLPDVVLARFPTLTGSLLGDRCCHGRLQSCMILSFAKVNKNRYPRGHETLGFPQDIGKTAPPGHRAPGARTELARGGTPGAGVGGSGVPMAAGVGAGGRGGLDCQASSRPATQADRATRRAIAATVAARGQGVWPPERALDLEAHGHGDLAGVPSTLSPLARVEGVAELAVELSGTGTPCPPARRTGDRPLEALPVASHKNKSEDLAPISRSSTKAAFCSSPRVVGPGRLRARRRSSSLAPNMTASQPWPPSPCRRS